MLGSGANICKYPIDLQCVSQIGAKNWSMKSTGVAIFSLSGSQSIFLWFWGDSEGSFLSMLGHNGGASLACTCAQKGIEFLLVSSIQRVLSWPWRRIACIPFLSAWTTRIIKQIDYRLCQRLLFGLQSIFKTVSKIYPKWTDQMGSSATM